ncbi:MAG TPA: glutathione S-transferase family protein [Rhizomicrobium sp.]
MITIFALKSAPAFARGLVRDLRVRWALEEAGLPYEARLIERGAQATDAYRALQPFGQVPVFEEDGLTLFETGAIVLYIGERSEVLLPKDAGSRARATMWLLAALNSIEVCTQRLFELDIFFAGQDWVKEYRPHVEARTKQRLAELAKALGDKDYLDGRFTAGDLMMTTVLRLLCNTDLMAAEPKLVAYQARCEARPAFQRALRDQMATFQG